MYADTLSALSHVLLKVGGRQKDAAALMQEAIAIVEESGSVVGTPVVNWLMDLAKVMSGLKRHSEAAAQLHKAMQYTVESLGEAKAQVRLRHNFTT